MNSITRVNYRIWLLSLMIFPFVQGGYFNYAALGFGIIQTLVLLGLVIQGRLTFRRDGVRVFAIGVFILSVLSFSSSIDQGMYPFGVLRTLIPVLVIVCYDSFKAMKKEEVNTHLAYGLIFSAATMSMVVMASLVFLPDHANLRSFFIQAPRVGGFFQYANTFGIYILGALILVVYKYPRSFIRRGLLSGLTMMMVLTQSRMVFVVFCVYGLIVFVFSPKNRQDILWMGGGILLGQGFLFLFLPELQLYRSYDLDVNASELQSRFLYYHDGLGMIFHRLRGYGYMGYSYVQKVFQTGATYHVRYIHSSFLQASLDYGLLAGGLFIGQLVFFLNKILQCIRQKKKEKAIAFIGITGVYLHSFLDFDVQFIAYVLFLYSGVLILEEEPGPKSLEDTRRNRYLRGGFLSLLILLFSYFMIPAVYTYQGDHKKALEVYPYYTKAMTGLLKEGEAGNKDAVDYVQGFIEQNPYYYEGFAFLREYYYNNGDLEKSLLYSYRCKELAPLWIENYERHLDISYAILHGRYEAGTLSKDDSLFSEVLTVEEELMQLEQERGNSYNIKHKAQFSLTPQMTRRINMTQRLLNRVME